MKRTAAEVLLLCVGIFLMYDTFLPEPSQTSH